MFKHVGGINRIGGTRRKRQPISDVQPQINFVERVGIDVDETWKILGPAAQMKVSRPVRRAQAVKALARKMIG